jgi:hypothetical protein
LKEICYEYTDSWTEYVSRLWDNAQKSSEGNSEKSKMKDVTAEKEIKKDPLGFFEMNFIVADGFLEDESNRNADDEDIRSDLEHIFIDPGKEYSKRDLFIGGGMSKSDLDKMLRKAEKMRYVSSSKKGREKLYCLTLPISNERG